MRGELKPEWNIKLTCLELGEFRTDIAGRSMMFAEKKHPAYDHLDGEKMMTERQGSQLGDPVKGAKLYWDVAQMEDPPARLLVGSDSYKLVTESVEQSMKTHLENKEISNSTNFADKEGQMPFFK